jgi:hypothetical protein
MKEINDTIAELNTGATKFSAIIVNIKAGA